MDETHFTRKELKTIYRAFKQTSPMAFVQRDTVRQVFAELFPHGDCESYADIIFNALDADHEGIITFYVRLTLT